jgi:hypothetical protein
MFRERAIDFDQTIFSDSSVKRLRRLKWVDGEEGETAMNKELSYTESLNGR